MSDDNQRTDAVELATELTIAWLGNPNTRASSDEVPAFLSRMHEAVNALGETKTDQGGEGDAAAPQYTPATTARRSLASKDHIISMIDGKPYKTLRRHLSKHGITPEEYRARFNLKADYPMVAPNYSEARRSMAKNIGLGRKPKAEAAAEPAETTPKPKRRTKQPTTAEAQ